MSLGIHPPMFHRDSFLQQHWPLFVFPHPFLIDYYLIAAVFCAEFPKELAAMMFPPLPRENREELMQNYSQIAWDEWIKLPTMLINERPLDFSEKEIRKWLSEPMMLFLENKDYKNPDGFIPLDR
jgi:Fe-S cluster protector protein